MGDTAMKAFVFFAVAATVAAVTTADDGLAVVGLDDELALVDMEGATCANAIRSAKTACGEKLAYYKKMHETNCGQTELTAVLGRIRRNHAKSKEQQAALKRAEDALRQVKYDEKGIAKMAHQAKERLLKAMGKEKGMMKGLSADEKNVLNELRDEKSLRSQAHRATLKAVRYAKTKKDFAPAKTEAGRAKGLYAKMVDEKVKIARDEYLARRGKGGLRKEKKTVAQLRKEAEAAREKEQKSAAKTEKRSLEKQITKAHKVTKEGARKVTTTKTEWSKTVTEEQTAKSTVVQMKSWDLKALLAQAGNLLKP